MFVTPDRQLYWEELRSLAPRDVCRRALVARDAAGFYTIPFLDLEFHLFPERELVLSGAETESEEDRRHKLYGNNKRLAIC